MRVQGSEYPVSGGWAWADYPFTVGEGPSLSPSWDLVAPFVMSKKKKTAGSQQCEEREAEKSGGQTARSVSLFLSLNCHWALQITQPQSM